MLNSLAFFLNWLVFVEPSAVITLAQPLSKKYPQLQQAGFLIGQAPEGHTTVVQFQTDVHAVRVFRKGNKHYMNLYNKQTSILTLNGVPVEVVSSDEGTNYIYKGELTFIAYNYRDGKKELLIEGYGERRVEKEL